MFKLWRIGAKEEKNSTEPMVGPLTSKEIKRVLGDSNDVIIKDMSDHYPVFAKIKI